MRRNVLMAAMLAATLACSCRKEKLPQAESAADGGWVTVVAGCVPDCATKSSALDGTADDRIANVNVYAYRKGLLEAESYSPDGSDVELSLIKGGQYNIYAIANVGRFDAPVREADLLDSRLNMASPLTFAAGLPMSCIPTSSYKVEGPGRMQIPLTRLVSKYSVRLDKDLLRCSFQVTGLRVRQAATSITPFKTCSAAQTVANGDSATAADLAELNAGGTVDFYVLENCCGVLLPDNLDPWSKTPDRIPSAKNRCTYVEVTCDWQTAGATADLGLRMYLGADNCSDFNVRRGVNAMLTLMMDDWSTVHPATWKVDLDYTSDTRQIWFWSEENVIYQGADWSEVEIVMRPENSYFNIIADPAQLAAAKMELKYEDGTLWARSSYDEDEYPAVRLWVETWDHAVCDSAYVKVIYTPGEYTSYMSIEPRYAGQYGMVEFDQTSVQRPVRVTLRDKVWTFTGLPAPVEHYMDPVSGNEYWADYRGCCLYVKAANTTMDDHLIVTRWKDRADVIMRRVDEPQVLLRDVSLSEGGNLKYDALRGIWYDDNIDIKLYSLYGEELPLLKFAVPDGLLYAQGLARNNQNRYSGVVSRYADGLSASALSNGYLLGQIQVAASDYDYALVTSDNSLHRICLYGKGGFTTDRTDLSIMVTCPSNTRSCRATLLKAFPSERYLGTCYNRQIAFGNERSAVTTLDMTSGGSCQAPFGNIVWDARHSLFSPSDQPSTAYGNGAADDYVAGLQFATGRVSFSEMTPDRYPSCGGVALHGRIVNPHNGAVIDGYYTVDIVLDFSIGALVDFFPAGGSRAGQMAFSYVPLCEYSAHEYADVWNTHFFSESVIYGNRPLSLSAMAPVCVPMHVPSSAGDNSLFVTFGGAPAEGAILIERTRYLQSLYHAFNPQVLGSESSTVDLTRSALPSTPLSAYSKGQKGYYRISHTWRMNSVDLHYCVVGY